MKTLRIKKLTIGISVLAMVLFVMQLLLLSVTISTTVARDTLSDQVPQLVIDVSTLESDYLDKRAKVTLSMAQNVGLVTNKDVTYVNRQDTVSYKSR